MVIDKMNKHFNVYIWNSSTKDSSGNSLLNICCKENELYRVICRDVLKLDLRRWGLIDEDACQEYILKYADWQASPVFVYALYCKDDKKWLMGNESSSDSIQKWMNQNI